MSYPELGQRLYIGGVKGVGTKYNVAPGWSIVEKINNKGNLVCTIEGTTDTTIEPMMEAYFYDIDDSTLLWAGLITKCDDDEVKQNLLDYYLTIEDFSAIADQPKAKRAYENKTIDYIVLDLLDKYLANSLNSDYDFSITEGTIQSNLSELNIISFNYMSLSKCFDKLAKFGNYAWNIDKNKQLNFHAVNYVKSPIIFNRDFSKYLSLSRSRGNQDYRNYQIVSGSKYIGDLRELEVVSPSPDGSNKKFLVKYPIAVMPRLWTYNGGVITEKSVGVLGYDNAENYDFYWSYDSNIISQNDSDAAIGAGIDIKVTYNPLIPLLVIYKDTAEINDKGLYEHYVKNELLQNKEDALTYAKSLTDKYAQIGDKLTLTLHEHTYNIMEQVEITDILRGISEETFYVESITWNVSLINHANIVYTYSLLDGAAFGGWEEIFKNMIIPEKINVNENEVIVVFKQDSETHTHDGEYDIIIFTDPLTPSATQTPTATLTPMNSAHSHDNVTD